MEVAVVLDCGSSLRIHSGRNKNFKVSGQFVRAQSILFCHSQLLICHYLASFHVFFCSSVCVIFRIRVLLSMQTEEQKEQGRPGNEVSHHPHMPQNAFFIVVHS